MPTLLLFTLFNILNYLDRFLVSALLPRIQEHLSIGPDQAGILASAFTVGYFVCAPIFGFLGDRYSRPLLMTAGVFLWSLATIASAYADTFGEFIVARICVGVGEAGFGAVAPGYLKDRYRDPARVNSVLSVFFSAIPVGAALGYVVGGLAERYSTWQAGFLFGGLPGLIGCWVLLRLNDAERGQAEKGEEFVSGVRQILASPLTRAVILGYALQTFALTGIATFISTYGVSIGFALSEITIAFGAILVVSGLVGTVGGGRLASKLVQRGGDELSVLLRFAAFTGLIAAPCLAIAFLLESHTMFLAVCFVAEVVVFASTGPVNSVLVLGCPPRLVTMTQGLCIFGINLLGYLPSPYLIGLAATQVDIGLAMQLTPLALLASSAVWFRGVTLRQRP